MKIKVTQLLRRWDGKVLKDGEPPPDWKPKKEGDLPDMTMRKACIRVLINMSPKHAGHVEGQKRITADVMLYRDHLARKISRKNKVHFTKKDRDTVEALAAEYYGITTVGAIGRVFDPPEDEDEPDAPEEVEEEQAGKEPDE